MALLGWALPRLSHLLPLDEDSLKEVITYTDTLSKPDAAEHLKNLLGDSPQALEFISTFNTRRPAPPEPANQSSSTATGGDASGSASEVPRAAARPKKKKAAFNSLPPPRRVEDAGNVVGAYKKRDEDDYMAGRSRGRNQPVLSDTLALDTKPDATQLPLITGTTPAPPRPQHQQPTKLPPSASGALISDSLPTSRSSSPSKVNPKTKINVSGGTSMRGQSATLNDLDSAIRALEVQTNPSLAATLSSEDQENALRRRRCNCMAQRHALLTAAPNCLNCGKIVCAKEGLGPCTSCGAALLSPSDIQAMVKVLREERGHERQIAANAAHKRPDVSKAPRPFATPSNATTPTTSTPASSDSETEKLTAAKLHRDRLLKFQSDNARRTRIHDEAADFDTPDAGTSMWATPQERALQLKRQQKVLREQEWSARPEFEKRRMVVSIDISGRKAVRRMAEVERPDFGAGQSEEDDVEDEENDYTPLTPARAETRGKGTFSRNPLLGSLIRPVFKGEGGEANGKGKGQEVAGKGKEKEVERQTTWRRVQDDGEDNERWILDGGAYGDNVEGRVLGAEERAVG